MTVPCSTSCYHTAKSAVHPGCLPASSGASATVAQQADASRIEALEARGEQLEAQLQRLCAALGNSD